MTDLLSTGNWRSYVLLIRQSGIPVHCQSYQKQSETALGWTQNAREHKRTTICATLEKQKSTQSLFIYSWIEAILRAEIAPIDKLEEELRNGISLAQLAKEFQPKLVRRIYQDKTKLVFKHSDNINYFFNAIRTEGLPEVFLNF
jgi:hypothetical protein